MALPLLVGRFVSDIAGFMVCAAVEANHLHRYCCKPQPRGLSKLSRRQFLVWDGRIAVIE